MGGAGPYLTLFSRAGIGRAAADRAAAKLEVYELPTARGCTYLVPAGDFALGLKLGQTFAIEPPMRTARKIGVTDAEIDRLCKALLDALSQGPLDPDQLRRAVGGAVRNLGEEGKKKGLTTTLPLALGRLQSEGEIRRVSTNGRLDQQRYSYALWRPSPLSEFTKSAEEAHTELARRFFAWIGPATLDEFRWFSGLGVKASKEAVQPRGLAALEDLDERWMLPEDLERWESFHLSERPQYALVSSLDSLFLHRRDVSGLAAPQDLNREVFMGKSFQKLSAIKDLPSNAIVDRGRLAGLWEYDVETQSIAWTSFRKPDRAMREAVEKTEQFIRSDLGDARSFSLDSPKSRAPRIEALRRSKF